MRKKLLFWRFILYYLIVLMVPIICVNMTYLNAEKVVKKEMERFNEALLRQGQSLMDERFYQIEGLAHDIISNAVFYSFTNKESLNDRPQDIYDVSKAIDELNKYNTLYDFIEDGFIYYSKSDTVIGFSGMYEAPFFFQEIMEEPQLSTGEWKALLTELRGKKFTTGGGQTGKLMYMQTFTSTSATKGATLVFMLDINRIRGILENIDILKRGMLYVLDDHHQVIIQAGEHEEVDIDHKITFSDEKKTVQWSSQKEEYIVSTTHSTRENLEYILYLPTRYFMKDMQRNQDIVKYLLFLSIIIGLGLSYYFARKNYNPINKLFNLLKEEAKEDIPRNELDYITHKTLNNIKKANEFELTIEKQKPIYRRSILLDVLKGNEHRINNIYMGLKENNIRLDLPQFCVLVLSTSMLSKDMDISIKELCGHMEMLYQHTGRAYIIHEGKGKFALILNVAGDTTLKRLYDMALDAVDYMEYNYALMCHIGIGQMYSSLEQIPKSYEEAIDALKYAHLLDTKQVVMYQDIKGESGTYPFTLKIELSLMDCLRKGEQEGMEEIIYKIIDDHQRLQSLSLDMMMCTFFDILGSMMKVISNLDIPLYDLYEGENLYKEMMEARHIQRMKEIIVGLGINLCNHLRANDTRQSKRVFKEEVLEYVRSHYLDQDFCLTKVADHFQVNHTYLSHFFKDQIGIRFIDYQRELKITKAMGLLKDESYSLNKIAEAVGYANSCVFIRNFKRINKMTPGQYREQMKKD